MKRTLIAGVAALAVAGLTSPLFAMDDEAVDKNAVNEELAREAQELTEDELNSIAPAAGEEADEVADEEIDADVEQ